LAAATRAGDPTSAEGVLVKRHIARIAKATGGLAGGSILVVRAEPVVAVLALTVVIVIGATCWVVADRTRARNLALLIAVALGGDRRLRPLASERTRRTSDAVPIRKSQIR
jgi:hypothetical protein